MRNNQLHKLKFITSNAVRQIVISLFSICIPFLVIHFSSKEVWGEFVSILLYTLFTTAIFNWGNKEYLLREFSAKPNKIKKLFGVFFTTRFPLLLLFTLLSFWFFNLNQILYIFIWLLGRFLIHSYEVLVIYERKFKANVLIEIICFTFFCLIFYFNKNNLSGNFLLVIFSIYQLLKGIGHFAIFNNYLVWKNLKFEFTYFNKSFWFLALTVLGFLACKIDVYIIEEYGNKTLTSDYQIINNLLVFVMSISNFIVIPYAKNLYRSNDKSLQSSTKTLKWLGFFIVLLSVCMIFLVSVYYLKIELSYWFFIIAFTYVFPSFIYGIDIIMLFKQNKEKSIVKILLIGVIVNFIVTLSLLTYSLSIENILIGSMLSQLVIAFLIKTKIKAI